MKKRSIPHLAAVAAAVLLSTTLMACGGGGATGPSDAQGVILRGTVVANALGSASSSTRSSAAVLEVSVLELPGSRVKVEGDSFTLRGLPAGQFTLQFWVDGVLAGTRTFASVAPNQEIEIAVAVTPAGVTVLEEKRNGIGHGDVEIEGRVDSATPVPNGQSQFVVDGRTVVARPAETAIREGNTARTVNDVTPGRQVHVKGRWETASTGAQQILALEIKLQGGDEEDEDDDGGEKTCLINGGKVGRGIELEGSVAGGGGTSFRLRVNGNRASGLVDVNASGATFDCKGGNNSAPTGAACQALVMDGARVHVRGTLSSCDLNTALVSASLVKVK